MSLSTYSPLEQRILSVLRGLPRNEKISTPSLIIMVYGDAAPLNPGQSIISAVRGLARKIARNGDTFELRCSDRRPPAPLEFWLDMKIDVKKRTRR